MKTRKEGFIPTKTVLIAFGLFGALALASAQTISNPSFESNSFTTYPGYISVNTNIIGWNTSDPNHTGLNPANGSPFADNGTIPDGNNVAFIQSALGSASVPSLSTGISNLTVGQTYTVNFRVNARAINGAMPNLKVAIDGTNVISSTIASVEPANTTGPYQYFAFDFTAANTNQTLTLSNDASNTDNTLLVDKFSIGVRNSGWSYAAWTNDASSGVVATNNYTHAYLFGSTNTATINGITFIGIAGGNPSSSGGQGQGAFLTQGLPAVFTNDANNLTTGAGGSAVMASNFLYGGQSFSGNTVDQFLSLDGLVAGESYVLTIYSVGFHGDIYVTNSTRTATFGVGNNPEVAASPDRLTVNQDQFGNGNGIRVSYAYLATASTMNFFWVPLQGAGQTFHTYGFSNYEVPGATNQHAAYLIVTNLADNGPGTLRQVIADAVSGDTITFATNGTIILTGGGLGIATNMNIVGPGPAQLAVDGNHHASAVFYLGNYPSDNINISGITIQNGNGGGIINYGTTVLSNCVITGNSVPNGADGLPGAAGQFGSPNGTPGGGGENGSSGGGIDNEGLLTLIACTVSNNSAGNGGNGGQGGAAYTVVPFNGSAGGGGSGGVGGNGGGIFNSSTLSLSACTVSGNTGGSGGTGGNGGTYVPLYGNGPPGLGGESGAGGGIYNAVNSVLNLTNCTVSNNTGGNGGGGGSGDNSPLIGQEGNSQDGGGIFNVGILTMKSCTVSGNKTGNGGSSVAGSEEIGGSGQSGGTAGDGGGIYNNNSCILIECTTSGNQTGNGGSGGSGAYAGGNGGNSGAGGGIFNNNSLTLIACTVSSNKTGNAGNAGGAPAGPGGNGGNSFGGGGIFNTGTAIVASLQNTLIAFNTNGLAGAGGTGCNCTNPDLGFLGNGSPGYRGPGIDLGGTFESYGHNLVGRSDGASLNVLAAGDITVPPPNAVIPLLGPLADNGGPTFTMALLPGSLAIDAGDDTLTNTLPTDQRGYPRLSGHHVDIGAFEVQVANSNNPPVLKQATLLPSGAFMFNFTNGPGLGFSVYASTNIALPLGQWIQIGTVTQSPPGQYQFTDPARTNYPQRFYKVVSQ